jgi:hypothetical protein
MKQPVDDVILRTKRYWYVDGLNEILVGVVFLLLGLMYLINVLTSPGVLSALVVGAGQPLIILLGIWLGGKMVRSLKERYTYPRTGYVAYSRPANRKRRWWVGFLAGVVAALVTFGLIKLAPAGNRNWLVFMTAALAAIFIFYIGAQVGVRRFYLLAMIALALGAGLALMSLTEGYQFTVLLIGNGLAWILSGAITLVNYLNKTHVMSEEPL